MFAFIILFGYPFSFLILGRQYIFAALTNRILVLFTDIVESYPLFSRKRTFCLSISNLFLPYIILLITFSLFTEPSASPLLYSYMMAFLITCISLFNPLTNLSIFLIFKITSFFYPFFNFFKIL